MAVFDKIFNITDAKHLEKINGSQVDSVAFDEDAVKALRTGTREDGIHLDGNDAFISAGTFALVFNTKDKNDQPIPGAITRLESMGVPAEAPIVLQPAFGKGYGFAEDDIEKKNPAYHAYIVPNAPDVAHPDIKQPEDPKEQINVTDDDVLRSLRVLKKLDLQRNITDLSKDNFVFLKNNNGEVMRYPQNASDPDFAGKPIAFLRDLNACPGDIKIANSLKGINFSVGRLKEKGLALDFSSQADLLCYSIDKTYEEGQQTTACEAIKSLVPGYDKKGNPLEDPAFVESLQKAYSDKPDPFAAFLTDAQNKLKEEKHPLKEEKSLKEIEAAPQDCVDACKQQYAITAKLADTLRKQGVEPNIPIPAATPHVTDPKDKGIDGPTNEPAGPGHG